MKYDPSTANVDRWHGYSDGDLAQGYKTVEGERFAPNSSNTKQLVGGTQPRDCDSLEEMSD